MKLVAVLLVLAAVGMTPAAASDAPGCDGARLMADRPLPVSPGSCSGVRPGAPVQTPLGFCTMNFLFTGDDGYRYIGTAGHCILPEREDGRDPGERRWSGFNGPWARDARGRIFGRFAYAALEGARDFALIRVFPWWSVSARMCHFGGPTGYFDSRRGQHVLQYYGNGLAIGDVLPARTAVTTYVQSRHHVYAYGFVVFGDSGAGVIDYNGKAVGVAVTTGAHYGGVWDNGLMGITRLKPQVQRAQDVMNVDLRLRTASLRD